ncbi:ABC transporter ATP-binding protein [Acinetobacter sp. BSP-28]|uniref:ABC transporter ATP-binding protein n=1 Tax=Acinetobacter sp. BSP-28 TaxID=3344661 RepID=UPI0037702F26
MLSNYAIRVTDLSKCYNIYEKPQDRLFQMLSFGNRKKPRQFWALKNITFSINRGETVGIIGRNGSGKSTLLQMICGTVTPTTGSIDTNGRVVALLELGAGFNPEFTGYENVLLNAAILGFPKDAIEQRMADVLEFSELGDFLDQPVKTYSSGMYARLAFSIAIHVEPEILIVDEALSVGDARFVAKCMKRIKEIQERGTTILFVSHDVGVVRTLCDRAIWLDKGMLVKDGDVFPVTGKYMEYMFQDELSEEKGLHQNIKKNIANQTVTDSLEQNDQQIVQNHHALDARPVTHWGARKGLILGASVCDQHGTRSDVIAWGEPIEIVVQVHVPLDIPRKHLSIACSIKDLKGTDLIVSTTHDNGDSELPEQEQFSIRFRMSNPLVTGKYLLVVAVENRADLDIYYYEYLEGAHYFSSLSEQRFFGIFQPAIEQKAQVL